MKLEVALCRRDKHPQLVSLVARRNREIGAEVAMALDVFQSEEEPANGGYVEACAGLADDVLHTIIQLTRAHEHTTKQTRAAVLYTRDSAHSMQAGWPPYTSISKHKNRLSLFLVW